MAIRGRGYHSMAPQSQSQVARSEPTRVIATDKGAVTSGGGYAATRRLQEQLGAKYDMNANRANRFLDARSRMAPREGFVGRFNRAVTAGDTAGISAYGQPALDRVGRFLNARNNLTTGFGGLSGFGFGNVLGGYNRKVDYKGNVTQQFSSGPQLR